MYGEDRHRAVRGLKKDRRRCKPSAHGISRYLLTFVGVTGPLSWSKNISSTCVPKSRAILIAKGRLGSYLPVSIALIVWRVTPTRVANSACDHSTSARKTRRRVFIGTAKKRRSGQDSKE